MTVTISGAAPKTFAAGGCTIRVLDDGSGRVRPGPRVGRPTAARAP